jgi:hypothetical protein
MVRPGEFVSSVIDAVMLPVAEIDDPVIGSEAVGMDGELSTGFIGRWGWEKGKTSKQLILLPIKSLNGKFALCELLFLKLDSRFVGYPQRSESPDWLAGRI